MLAGAQPASADAELSLTKSSPSSVLAGEPVTFTLTATNPGDQPEFNLSFRDELPVGVTYVPGSSSPAGAGEPTIVTNSVEDPPGSGEFVDQQTLIWKNVADLQPGDSTTISFQVTLSDTAATPGARSTSSAPA
ncbi:hypothetical protein GCM10025865_04190 [Paraoerskovia sediminicola]|uniref:DUF11 domain-containing protein n=2 Tax=Paraoerskovia sediminicola TaxID=1138587 RepID=A0ABM8FZP7_9CELL|nr:hypothetical protein GCM10025865_04190 [Paraoerskovia sediminicola]